MKKLSNKISNKVTDSISNAVTQAHVFSEKFNFTRNMANESTLHDKIKEVWNTDKETIENGFRNGPLATQHGVNAEYQHIADFNINEVQQAALEGREALLMTKAPELNGPADMVRGDQLFQAKYYNSPKGSLDACIKHLEKYDEKFGAGTDSVYVIAPEHHSNLLAIKQGQVPEGFTARQAEGIRASIEQFEAKKGPIENSIQPGSVTYNEAQIENVDKVVAKREKEIEERHENKEKEIKENAAPSVSKMFKQAGISALISGMFSVYRRICKDQKDGKNVFAGEYEKEDFFALAKEFVSGGFLGGINSSIVYGINAKFENVANPVTATYGIAKNMFGLAVDYNSNKITSGELYEQSCTSTAVTILSAMGNAGCAVLLEMAFTAMGMKTVPALLTFGSAFLAGIAVGYVVNMLVDFIKDNYGEKIKEIVFAFIAFLNKVCKSQKIKVAECKKEAGEAVKALTANISSRFETFKCLPSF